MKTIQYILVAVLIGVLPIFSGCKKFLDEKPDQSLNTPQTADDLQKLLDGNLHVSDDVTGDGASDNFIYKSSTINNFVDNNLARNFYIWGDLLTYDSWDNSYNKIFETNVVLDNIDKVSANSNDEKNFVKGQALFNRAWFLFSLAQTYTLAYTPGAADLLGLPIKLSSDINTPTTRSNLQQTYAQIIQDYKQAVDLLPVISTPATRPNKPAALAALARTLLVMQDYSQARSYADQCLSLRSELLDFNTLNPASTAPVPIFNKEVILQRNLLSFQGNIRSQYVVVQSLLDQYNSGDLRKGIFYQKNADGTYYFKGAFDGNPPRVGFFSGLALDEVYLIKAECEARLGNPTVAMDYLNRLLAKRSAAGFMPLNATTAEQALQTIIIERRKELAFRGGTRWMDLKRLNLDPRFAVTLTRDFKGQTYTLPPNSLKYAFLIPIAVIQFTGIEQNKR